MAFNFGNNSSSTPNKPLFGGGAASSGTSNLFGSANNTTSAGTSTPAAAPSLFGAAGTGGSTLFGGASTTPAASKPLFGNTQATAGASQPASSPFSFKPAGDAGGAAKPSLFGGAGTTASSGATTGGAPAATGGFSFGKPAASSTPAATPAPSKTFALPSTTPAGPPPGKSLFGATPASSAPSLFGGAAKPATSSTPLFGGAATPAQPTTGGASAFGGFGNKDASTAKPSIPGGEAAPQATPKPSLFSLGSTTPAATPANKLTFGLGSAANPTQSGASQPAFSATPGFTLGSNKSTPFSLGGDKSTPASIGNTFANPMSSTPSLGSAGGANSSAAQPAASTATSGGATGATAASSSTAPAASTATSSGGFSLFPTANPTTPASGATAAGATTSTAAGATTSTAAGATTGTAAPSTTSTAAPAATTATSGDAAKTGFASSTAGPAPSAQSRLKNKSMDEIITRWASDLNRYQKEFQAQAATIAKWDRALVENSDRVKQLYTKTFQAERDAQEVEKHLTHIENNQSELDHYLDKYEKEIDQMMQIHGVSGRTDSLRGPDQERERTYKLAEKLQDRLNELNKDLTEMIEEINTTSQTLSKSGKPDDPLTKVVRVLNSQLAQLQSIDVGAKLLEQKIEEAQKQGRGGAQKGWNGLGSDAVDDFYRSFRGGRSQRFGGVS